MALRRRKFELAGQKLNYLFVLEKVVGKGEWLCQCDCGKILRVRAEHLISGRYISCGCKFSEHVSKKKTLPNNLARKNALFLYCKRSGRSRGYDFSLTFDEFCLLISSSCEYCGAEPSITATTVHWDSSKISKTNFKSNGIDRVDNTLGYTKDNCVAACGICNKAKHDLPLDKWLAWVDRLITFQMSKRGK